MERPAVLGVDIGSVSVSCALLGPAGEVCGTRYRFHRGRVRDAVAEALREIAAVHRSSAARVAVGVTGAASAFIPRAPYFDPQVCLIAAGRRLAPGLGAILHIGGERFGLIRFGAAGEYEGARGNSSCAAGTGSFLDQQARRLGLAGSHEVAGRALTARGEPPRISSRCAVFARTDLVHAQQAGYPLAEICDGLCRGLARNVSDALRGGEAPRAPVLFVGGVAANEAVRRHLEQMIGAELRVHEHSAVAGAIGAALLLLEQLGRPRGEEVAEPLSTGLSAAAEQLAEPPAVGRQYFFEPLAPLSTVAAAAAPRSMSETGRYTRRHPVEVEVYREIAGGPGRDSPTEVWLGIDVGSTSTKAMLTASDGSPLVGLYTRTLGAPVTAVQALLESIGLLPGCRAGIRILGVAATGAGRRFVGKIIGADLIVNEITAHARAARELDPEVDTIIEIGGQDAKFTLLADGRVTFAHMNTVCAAGTGSFLEEQAARLGCDLSAYDERAVGVRAPLVSDRCAVFMERDTNDLLGRGHSVEEILAASLFAVRENYLSKVVRGHRMGNRICFQGATGRNRALVAAFEQGLGTRIAVSPYCHLTGAWGAAQLLREDRARTAGSRAGAPLATAFRGLEEVLRQEIPIRGETCALCANHCRLRIAEIAGETVAYGFLCGRDYDTRRFVSANRSGFDPVEERRKAYAAVGAPGERASGRRESGRAAAVIGLPAALTMREELSLWRRFFACLEIPVATSEGLEDSVALGRDVQGAEFCVPLASLHGHAAYLAERTDWLFLPVHLQERRDGDPLPRCYCYYTQYAPSLVSAIGPARGKCLMPLVSLHGRRSETVRELRAALGRAGFAVSVRKVAAALDAAVASERAAVGLLQSRFHEEIAAAREPCVVLVGRPYTLCSDELAKGIPSIFGSLGARVFLADMVPYGREEVAEIRALLDQVHWRYASGILEVALVAARTPMLYPVYVTSFKCSPDSFALEYYRRICEAEGKPYLVLELDDHDSTIGYETRIEAGLASFRNHAVGARRVALRCRTPERSRASPVPRVAAVVPRVEHALDGRTLLMPMWDSLVIPLAAAALRGIGIDARPLEEDPLLIRAAMRHNTGQCIPVSIIAEEAMRYVERHELDPARTAVWMARSGWACNLPMFPAFLKTLFESRGFPRLSVYRGDISLSDLGLRASIGGYRAALVGGMLRSVGCRLRPYEREPGSTDAAIRSAMAILLPAFERRADLRRAVREAADLLGAVEVRPGCRPKAAIFGDLYVRDNDVMSQDLIRAIEAAGGEAVVTGYVDYWRIIMPSYLRKWPAASALRAAAIWRLMERSGRPLRQPFERFLDQPRRAASYHWSPPRRAGPPGSIIDSWLLAEFAVRPEHDGESFDNLMKVYHLAAEHPDLRLFVQASPAFCCPSLVTEAMARDIQRVTGIPVVSVTYDGTGRYRNDAIVPYLQVDAGPGSGRLAKRPALSDPPSPARPA